MSDLGRVLSKWVAILSMIVGLIVFLTIAFWYMHDGDDGGTAPYDLTLAIWLAIAFLISLVLFGFWIWLLVWDKENNVECRSLWVILSGYGFAIFDLAIKQNMFIWPVGLAFIFGGVLLWRENRENYY